MRLFKILLYVLLIIQIRFSAQNNLVIPTLNMKFKIYYDQSLQILFDTNNEMLRNNATALLRLAEFELQLAYLYLSTDMQLLDVGYVEISESVIRDSNKFLKKFCYEQRTSFNKTRRYMWYTVLITDVDFYSTEGKKKQSGCTFVGEHCSIDRSCLMLRYDTRVQNLARAFAQEIVHSLGVKQDDKCLDRKPKKPKNWLEGWPVCNREDINKNLILDKFSCLGDKSLREAVVNYFTPLLLD